MLKTKFFKYMFSLLALVSLLTVLMPQKSYASFWIACDVWVTLGEVGKDGLYPAKIEKALITDGHMLPGENCMVEAIGKTKHIDVEADELIPTDTQILLRYNYYNAMGPAGVVNSETWQYLP